jgi:uncharacterized NAD(P)/FAD-binding protein YdhS
MSFKVQNWPAYEAGLRQRGSLTLWIEDGALEERNYALGPVTSGTFWEIVAIPDIRQQVQLLARRLSTRTRDAV